MESAATNYKASFGLFKNETELSPYFKEDLKENECSVVRVTDNVTRKLHTKIQHHIVFKSLFDKTLPPKFYAQYLTDLACVYRVLELRVKFCVKKNIINLPFTKFNNLKKHKAIQKDIKVLNISRNPTMAAKKYEGHLEELNPALLICHAYVLYFGALNAGTKIRAKLGKDSVYPTNHYYFPDQDFTNTQKSITTELNQVEIETKEFALRFFNEMKIAFGFSMAILDEACSEESEK